MQPELRQFIDQARFYKASVLRFAEMLPPDDAALDELMADSVRGGDQMGFMFIVLAALVRERRLDSRHLARGAMMFPSYGWFPLVGRFDGDVAEHLMAAIEQTQLRRESEAVALLLAAAWCEDHRGGTLPDQLIPTARKLARNKELSDTAQACLISLAVRAKDSGLLAVTQLWIPGVTPERWQPVEAAAVELGNQFLAMRQRAPLDFLPEKPNNILASGITVRRAVARVGRNDPCRCGSGKKYKRCCYEPDQERLHRSTEVAGLTQEELHSQPEFQLTRERLDRTDPFLLERFDPAKIPDELLRGYFMRLCAFNLFDRAAAAFEQLGYTEAREQLWHDVIFMASRAGHKDSLRRLAKLHPDPVKLQEEIYTGAALLLAEDNPAELLKMLNELAESVLEIHAPKELETFAIALMYSGFRALGILVGRGAIPLLPQHEAANVFNEILSTRDKLNLSPEDPIGDVLDQRLAAQEDDHLSESAELRRARRNLDTKAQEVRELKDSLERLQKEIARREEKRATPTQADASPTAPAVDEQTLKELRRKLEELKSALKQRHHERNDLRRELQKAHTDLETLRQNAAPAASDEAEPPDREEELLLPQDAPEIHPLRVIEFPKGFQQMLGGFPRQVARAALIMAGRLAAGEPAAFVGALRLKATPKVMRQRIGSDFRLLFRLWPDRLELIDLINRKDLDRRIKTLV